MNEYNSAHKNQTLKEQMKQISRELEAVENYFNSISADITKMQIKASD